MSLLFLWGGANVFRNPAAVAVKADSVLTPLRKHLPGIPATDLAVRANAAVQIVAAVAFAVGKYPRCAAALLAGSLVPTTAAGHRFWHAPDPDSRRQGLIAFLSNVGIFGGLALAASARSERERSRFTPAREQ